LAGYAKIFILLFCLPLLVNSQNHNIQFTHLTTKDGLSSNRVNAIIKDADGYMWFGTDDGLNRYDGYTFKIYKHDPDDSLSISGNNIQSLFEDRYGNIWVGTHRQGLNKFDKDTETFRRFKSMNSVFSIYEDLYQEELVLWLGCNVELIKFYADRALEQHISNDSHDPDTTYFRHYHASQYGLHASHIAECDSQNLYLGSAYGLMKFNKSSETVTRYLRTEAKRELDFMIVNMYRDHNGKLWLATTTDGLNTFDQSTGKYTLYKNNPDDPYSIGCNFVHDINEDKPG
jgi:ligand-binding sensor domain-containing protein